jgi:hypothetical protein
MFCAVDSAWDFFNMLTFSSFLRALLVYLWQAHWRLLSLVLRMFLKRLSAISDNIFQSEI